MIVNWTWFSRYVLKGQYLWRQKSSCVYCGEAFCKQMTVVPRISAINHASQKKTFSPKWSLYTFNPKLSLLNVQGIQDSWWKLTQSPQETTNFFSLICHLWDWKVHIHSSRCEITSFLWQTMLLSPLSPTSMFLLMASFPKPLVLVGSPDPTWVFASLTFPH